MREVPDDSKRVIYRDDDEVQVQVFTSIASLQVFRRQTHCDSSKIRVRKL